MVDGRPKCEQTGCQWDCTRAFSLFPYFNCVMYESK